jgi:hypothetical protein
MLPGSVHLAWGNTLPEALTVEASLYDRLRRNRVVRARPGEGRVSPHLGHSRWSWPTLAQAHHFLSAVIDAS